VLSLFLLAVFLGGTVDVAWTDQPRKPPAKRAAPKKPPSKRTSEGAKSVKKPVAKKPANKLTRKPVKRSTRKATARTSRKPLTADRKAEIRARLAEARRSKSAEVPKPSASRAVPRVHAGQQGKHIPGHRNYIPGRSPFTHPDPQGLLDRFAGTGQAANKIPRGQPGFRERVDFREVIGKVNGQPTTKGIIHYGKGGAHIVPANP
jgi:hypothetical protein